MSYIVLARKWRPQSFDDLIGQEPVARTIKNALQNEKVVHAYLFSGPRGVGKTSAARILAKALNCLKGSLTEPCGKCQNCISITDGSSVDVLEIDGASNNSVEDIRELRETVKYAPSSCKYKVYIIDEVHMLSASAFNALLKTLEEPPPHVIFVFATTESKKVPSTILSRCQHHAFRRIPKLKIKERLSEITRIEKININEIALEMIARAADGSMRDALTMLDQASSFSEDITEKELQTLLGLPETDIILSLAGTILSGDISKTLSIIKDLAERGYDLRAIIKELIEHFRNIAIVKIIQRPDEFLEFTEEEIHGLQHQASQVNIEEITLLLSELLKLESELRSATNPRYVLELGLLKTSFIKGMTSINDILKILNSKEDFELSSPDKTETKPYQSQRERESERESEKKLFNIQEGSDKLEVKDKDLLWEKITERLKSNDPLLSCKAAEAKVVDITDKDLIIGFNGWMSILVDSVKKNISLIETIIKDITGNKLKLKIVSLPSIEKKNLNEIKQDILSNPLVKEAMELFSGALVDVKSLDKMNHNS